MNTKHTPGPWETNPYCGHIYIEASLRPYVHQEVAACGPTEHADQQEANARLVAAAPDLLSAAYAIEGASEYMEFDPDSRFGEALSMIVAAIAKALGE